MNDRNNIDNAGPVSAVLYSDKDELLVRHHVLTHILANMLA